jgi:polysaccharide biosynthesis/export protein
VVKTFKILFSFVAFIFIITQKGNAQDITEMSDTDIMQYYQKAKDSGMNDAEIEAATMAKGISVEAIARLKNKAIDSKNVKSKTPNIDKSSDDREIDKEGEDDKEKKKEILPPSKVFGANIFRNNKITFEPNLKLATPKNYILGTGDELNIDVSGYASVHYTSKVSTEGNIKIENLSPIYVSGLTIEQAKDRIINRLKSIFAGLDSPRSGLSTEVTLGSIRSIKVMMIGEVMQPGTYTLPSLASVFNALYAAGGPTDKGSFRNIEIYRSGKPYRKLDVYDFLNKGDQRNNVILQDQDVVRIPFYKKQVSIIGEVKAPLTYELEDNEKLSQVLEMAGGYTGNAYTKSLNIDRVTPTNRQIITVLAENFKGFDLLQGDTVKVEKLRDFYDNMVVVEGAIYRPGSYDIAVAKTVKGLVQLAGGTAEDVFLNRALIKRRDTLNYNPTLIAFDLGKLLSGASPDIILLRTDTLLIKASFQLRENRTVKIDGEIVKSAIYPYADNMTVSDLVVLAGGLKEGASLQYVEIARRVRDTEGKTNASTEILNLSIDGVLKLNAEDSRYIIQPFDQVFIRALPNYSEQRIVTVSGEIKYAGNYAIKDKGERIYDLIQRAGGLKPDAYLHGARFTRAGKVVGIDIKDIMKDPSLSSNLLLIKGDVLDVPRIKETVDVLGQVLNPTSVGYSGDVDVEEYINKAGGFTDSANVKKIYVKYANGTVAQTKSFLGFKKYPKIENGAEIYVPVRKRKKAAMTIAESVALVTGFSTVATLILTLIRLKTI